MESNILNFNIFNSVILAGIIQGFVFGLVVVSSGKYKSAGINYLVAMIVCFSLNNLQYYLMDAGIITSQTLYAVIFIPYPLISGVFLLFYGLCLINPDGKLPRGAKWMLVPFIVGFLLSSSYKILYAMGYSAQIISFFAMMMPLVELVSIIMDMSIVIYLLVRIQRLEQKSALPLNRFPHRLNWFRIILIVFFFLGFLWIFNAIMSYVYGVETAYYPIWLAMCVMIYWLGHVGIYTFGIQEERKKIRNYSIANKTSFAPAKQKNGHISALEHLMVGEKRFLDPTLTLEKVAEELHLSKSHLSRIIHTELGTGFPDYLNALRVAEAKSYLSNPDFANYTLLAIGLEAGFNSKTTFNSAFKKITSLTPSEFRSGASN